MSRSHPLTAFDRTELAAIVDALETAHQFAPDLGEPERGAMITHAETLTRLLAAGGGRISRASLGLSPLHARALRYAAGTDAALTGEAYAGLPPGRLRAIAGRIDP